MEKGRKKGGRGRKFYKPEARKKGKEKSSILNQFAREKRKKRNISSLLSPQNPKKEGAHSPQVAERREKKEKGGRRNLRSFNDG